MGIVIFLMIPITFAVLFIFLDALFQTLEEESQQVPSVPRTKADWKEEQARAIAYSKKVLTHAPILEEPKEAVSQSVVATKNRVTNPVHHDYIRNVCNDSVDFLSNQAYQLTLSTTEEAYLLQLTYQKQVLASARIQNHQIMQIDYGYFAPSEQYAVRHYFKQIKDAIDFERWQTDEGCPLQNHHLNAPLREKQEQYNRQQRTILHTYDHILVLLDELDKKEGQLSLEWQHKRAHHFREPIADMMKRYRQLSQEEKANTHEAFSLLLEETLALLQSQTEKLNQKETEILLRDMALLKKRLQTQ